MTPALKSWKYENARKCSIRVKPNSSYRMSLVPLPQFPDVGHKKLPYCLDGLRVTEENPVRQPKRIL